MVPPSSGEKVCKCSAEGSPRPPHTGTPKADHSVAPDRAVLLSSGVPGLRDTPGTPLFTDSLECSRRRDLARDP